MRALVTILVVLLGAMAWPAKAMAQNSAPSVTQELSAALGLEMGVGGTTPGGLRLAGAHLYRLAESDWLHSEIAVTYGNPGSDCITETDGTFECEHGLLDGVAVQLGSGIRRYFESEGQLVPFARAGLALRLVSFPSDDVSGVGAVVVVGGGVRAEVADGVAVIGSAAIQGGAAILSRDLGGEPQLSLVVQGGAEFSL